MHFNTVELSGTAGPLNDGVSLAAAGIALQADPTNTTDLFVGDANSQPIRLTPGATLRVAVGDVTQIWAKAASGSPSLNWVAGNAVEIIGVSAGGGGGGGGSVTQGTVPWVTDNSGVTQPVSQGAAGSEEWLVTENKVIDLLAVEMRFVLTTAGTVYQPVAVSTPLEAGVAVTALNGNIGRVWVKTAADITAGTTPATDGKELLAGDERVIPIDNALHIWVVGEHDGDSVYLEAA